ncbi:MAG: DUF503 domain-containing protein [candidate division WOR-3 bacterium]
MNIALLLVDCFLGECLSLKEKRRILTSLTERLRRSFNIALCEVDYQNQWQRSLIAVVLINTDWRMIQQNSSKIINLIENDGHLSVLGTKMERLR